MPRHAMYENNQLLIQEVEHTAMSSMTQPKALEYLEKHGFTMSLSTYQRLLARLRGNVTDRLDYIAYKEFAAEHIRSIDTIRKLIDNMYAMAFDENAKPHVRIRAAEVADKLINTKQKLYDGGPIVAAIANELNKAKVEQAKHAKSVITT